MIDSEYVVQSQGRFQWWGKRATIHRNNIFNKDVETLDNVCTAAAIHTRRFDYESQKNCQIIYITSVNVFIYFHSYISDY